MKLKTLGITLAVLALGAAIVSLSRNDQPKRGERVGEPLLQPTLLEGLEHLSIATAQGETITLTRRSGQWWVDGDLPVPADFTQLTSLSEGLMDAEFVRLVSDQPATLERLELEQMTLTLGQGAEAWTLHRGKRADNGGYYVRLNDEEAAWLVSGTISPATTPNRWADPTPVELEPEAVLKISLQWGEENLEVTRADTQSPWTAEGLAEGESLNQSALNQLLNTATGLRPSQRVARDDAEAAEALNYSHTIGLHTATGVLTLRVGQRPEVATAQADDEEATTIPAGPVFSTIEVEDLETPWAEAFGKLAFQLPTFSYQRLAPERGIVVTAPPAPAPEAETTPPAPAASPIPEALRP